tara:strand:- start:2124 stop:2822 length:699 start_codon:yes stop_codon:yes gene_type:complete
MSYSTKKFLQKEVPKLSKNEYHEIFNIIKLNTDSKYSENSTGVYVNLKYLNQITIEKITDFIKYTKCQKDSLQEAYIKDTDVPDDANSYNTIKNDYTHMSLSKRSVEKELSRLRDKKNESFVFQNFLDKLSITNIKQFHKSNESGDKIIYPQLKHTKIQFNGVKARLLKKCREVHKNDNELPFIPSDDAEYVELTNNDEYITQQIDEFNTDAAMDIENDTMSIDSITCSDTE